MFVNIFKKGIKYYAENKQNKNISPPTTKIMKQNNDKTCLNMK